MQQLLNHIKTYAPLGQEAQLALEHHFEQQTLSKNELLLAERNTCRYMYFIQHGGVRGVYNLDGKEITHWFGFENDFVTSFHSYITGEPAVENIQAIEGSIIWAISKNRLEGLFDLHPDIERMVRVIQEKYYIRLEERFVNAQFKTAAERYENLLQQSPHIIERVSLGHVASYLGISQETLSRIRGRI